MKKLLQILSKLRNFRIKCAFLIFLILLLNFRVHALIESKKFIKISQFYYKN